MRTIFAMVALFAVLALGGIGGTGFQGHSYDAGQIVADGENGSGG